MATPDFIRTIRAAAGHQLLWLPGVTAIVFDDAGRVLLGRRTDTRRWSVIGGIPEPGEQPAACAVREVFEETAVRCVAERVVLFDGNAISQLVWVEDRAATSQTAYEAPPACREPRTVNVPEGLGIA